MLETFQTLLWASGGFLAIFIILLSVFKLLSYSVNEDENDFYTFKEHSLH